MCGIAGIFAFNSKNNPTEDLLQQMGQCLIHRGPDDSGIYKDNNLGFSFRRLSIIDLSPKGHQPMHDLDQSITLVCNGEIYNYQSLRLELKKKGYSFKSETDVETLIYAYKEWGENFIDRIEGMFAFALWDKREGKLFLARDRLGIKPLYYYLDDGIFAFASEIKSILTIPSVQKEIDEISFYQYLTWMQVPSPRTIYKNIKKLLPGECVVINKNSKPIFKKYWTLKINEDLSKSDEYWEEGLEHHLSEAVKKHLISDVPVGVFLSGGVDSSTLVALAAPLQKEKVKTFSVSFENEVDFDETLFQKRVSSLYKTDHIVKNESIDFTNDLVSLLKESDEPFAISSAFALSHLCEITSQHVKVVLSGDGADELLGGYSTRYIKAQKAYYQSRFFAQKTLTKRLDRTLDHLMLNSAFSSQKISHKLRKLFFYSLSDFSTLYQSKIQNSLNPFEKALIVNANIYNEFAEALTENYDNSWNDSLKNKTNQALEFELKTMLPDEMLTKADRCSSMHSLEARVPFLDDQLVSFCLKMPLKYKTNNNEGKILLKKIMEKHLPKSLLYRKKQGFNVPLSSYLKNYNFDKLYNFSFPLLNSATIKSWVNLHRSGKQDLSTQLWILEVFRVWYQEVSFFK